MKILIACEYSGRVRDAFLANGHDAMSCDLLPTEVPGPHYQGSVADVINEGWDLAIFHPPCTHLAVSGARHFAAKQASGVQQDALDFVRLLLDAPIPRIALENPISIISSRIRKPDQIIQPWMFGEDASKSTCLWLKGLPLLKPTNIIEGQLYCCGLKIENGDVRGCPNCNGDKKAKRIYGNQTPSGQNNFGPSPTRWKERSRTFEGIASAFAAQWGGQSVSDGSGCDTGEKLREPAIRDLSAADFV